MHSQGYPTKRSPERREELRAAPLLPLPCPFSRPCLCPSRALCLKPLSHSSLWFQPTRDSNLLQEVFSDALLPSQ